MFFIVNKAHERLKPTMLVSLLKCSDSWLPVPSPLIPTIISSLKTGKVHIRKQVGVYYL